jgi:hypothetical protein
MQHVSLAVFGTNSEGNFFSAAYIDVNDDMKRRAVELI